MTKKNTNKRHLITRIGAILKIVVPVLSIIKYIKDLKQ